MNWFTYILKIQIKLQLKKWDQNVIDSNLSPEKEINLKLRIKYIYIFFFPGKNWEMNDGFMSLIDSVFENHSNSNILNN